MVQPGRQTPVAFGRDIHSAVRAKPAHSYPYLPSPILSFFFFVCFFEINPPRGQATYAWGRHA
jgi:hypothetical protein